MHRHITRSRALPCLLAVVGTALGACADVPAAPAPTFAPRHDAIVADDPFTVTTTADAGIGSLRWVLRYADSGQVGFCLWMRADVAVARPAALARIQGIIP